MTLTQEDQQGGFCLSCQHQLSSLDVDPDGAENTTCAKCRAEESHDFDAQPDALFDRAGRRIEAHH